MKFLFLFILIITLSGCLGNNLSMATFSYRTITDADLEDIQSIWSSRDLSAREVELVYEKKDVYSRILIFRYSLSGNIQYGAIALPNAPDLSEVPVVIIAVGLNQKDRIINVGSIMFSNTNYGGPLANFIKIIPAFRGQILYLDGVKYEAEGDFLDAFDGAVDDSIGMLNVAQAYVPEGRYDKVLVCGRSRGGNTGLLLAMRDPRINTVLATAAPVDFYRKDVRAHYGFQYMGQFFSKKSHDESRQHILASSPLFFKPLSTIENIFLYHGTNDKVVPRWNVDQMYDHLLSLGINVQSYVYEGGTHSSFYYLLKYKKDFKTGIDQFLYNISKE